MRMSAREALVAALAARAGEGATASSPTSQAWASATFAGARHRVALRLPAGAIAAFEDGLGEAQFSLRGHILVDIAIVARREEGDWMALDLEALTIEES